MLDNPIIFARKKLKNI